MAREEESGLPKAPPPNPARRQEAIAAAMRRFDGESESPAPVPVRPAPWWNRIGKPQISLAVTAALVAVIAVPTVWTSIQPYSAPPVPSLPQHMDVALEPAPVEPSAPQVQRDAAAPPPTLSVQEKPTADNRAVASSDAVADRIMPPGIVAPPSPPPPPPSMAAAPAAPPPPPAMAKAAAPTMAAPVMAGRAAADSARAEREEDYRGANDIVVTSQRRRNSRADERGDWNACTINDPARSLKRCGSAIRAGAKGDAGRAAALMADGLTRGWEGDSAAAASAFDQAVAITPKSTLAYLNRGLAYQQMGEEDRALASFDQAIRTAPSDPRGYFARSTLLRQRGDRKRAAADEAKAVSLDPDYEGLTTP